MQKFRCNACDKNVPVAGSRVKYLNTTGMRSRVCAKCAGQMQKPERKEKGGNE